MEAPEVRARRVLAELLPVVRNRDDALDTLYMEQPAAHPLWVIAAALYILEAATP